MQKYTPGPWEVSTLDGRTIGPVRTVIVEDEGGWTQTPLPQLQAVAVVKERTGETAANARLLAAAPELLAALERILPWAEKWVEQLSAQMAGGLYPGINEAALERARAAIVKAAPLPD
jgi:hypothetical protein